MKDIKIIWQLLKERGVRSVLSYKLHRIRTQAKVPKLLPGYGKMTPYFKDRHGLEIGGPSRFFNNKGPLPIYPLAASIDNINYAPTTVWTGEINEELGYIVNKNRFGQQFIFDAIDLKKVKRGVYDFVFSCNVLEHFANPIRAIEEWLGVLRTGGLLIVVVPKKESNFDHNRQTVTFAHLIEDYRNDTQEDDMTHFSEIMAQHDLQLDPMAGTRENFRKRSLKNIENRCLHHHVFDLKVMKEVFQYFDLKIIKTVTIQTDYIILGRKTSNKQRLQKGLKGAKNGD